MKHTVPCNDEALLLLLHGELPLGAMLRLRLHLWTCPICHERAGQYAQLSVGLASSLNRPGQSPRFRGAPAFFPSPLWLIPGLIAVILGSFGAVLLQWRKLNPPRVTATATSTASVGQSKKKCAPPLKAVDEPCEK